MNREVKSYFLWLNAGKPHGMSDYFWRLAEMDAVNITWTKNYTPAQIYSAGIEFALCSDDNNQIGPFVLCKDFFQDLILASLHNTICSIYNYQYNPKTMPAPPDKNFKVLLANSRDKEFFYKIPSLLNFINQIEERVKVEKTTISLCQDPPKQYAGCGVYLLTADKQWMHAPPLMSMWTLLVRNGTKHKIGKTWEETIQGIIDGKIPPAQVHDHTFMKFSKPGLDLIIEKGIDLFAKEKQKNYPKDKAGSAMHHYSGIVGYGSGKGKMFFPDWEYPEQSSEPPSVCFS